METVELLELAIAVRTVLAFGYGFENGKSRWFVTYTDGETWEFSDLAGLLDEFCGHSELWE